MAFSNPYTGGRWGDVFLRDPKTGSLKLPGIVTSIDGHSKPETWVVQQGIQVSHAISIWRGTKLAEEIKIQMNLFDAASFDAYDLVRKKLRPKLGGRPPIMYIVNAAINTAGITRISCKDVLPPVPAAGNSWLGEIRLIEFNVPKLAPIGPGDPPKAKSENDLLADEFVKTLAAAKKLP